MIRYTVKQLANLAGVTNRTLHYYDEIGLLYPAEYGDNGYRFYNEDAVIRLQQILFYRELDFSLDQIKAILEQPDFDLLHALEGHRRGLQEQAKRINRLIETVDSTILHLRGEISMNTKDFYAGFDEEKQKAYAQEAQQRWGETVAQSQQRWNQLKREDKNSLLAQMNEISTNIANNMDKRPESPEVQDWIERWYQHINHNFYECSLEIFEALGHMYTEDEAFKKTYEAIRPGMAAFMEKAMTHFCRAKSEK